MIEEPFAVGGSFLHRRDARVKIGAAAAFILAVALTASFLVAAVALLVATALVASASLPGKMVAQRLLAANLFILFVWLTLPLSYGGETVGDLGWLRLSRAGVVLCALITLKANAIVLASLALLSTSTIASLGRGLEGLALPAKLVFLLLSTYRYLFVIHQEYERLQRAAILRGFVARTSLHTYRSYGYLFAMTLVKSWNRAKRVQQAMLLRGFTGQLIPLPQPRLLSADWLFFVIFLVLSGLLTALNLL